MSGLGSLNGHLIGAFATSITPIYFSLVLGVGFCFTNVLKPDFAPAFSVLLQYICLPALMFLRLATNDPANLNLKLLGADALSKFVPLAFLLIWWGFFSKLGKVKSIEWVITYWMLATLPNTVVLGDNVLLPMFKADVLTLNTTIIFAQTCYWYNCVIFLYEIRETFIEDDLANNPIPVDPAVPAVEMSADMTDLGKQQRSFGMDEMEKSRMSRDMGRPSPYWEFNRPSLTWDRVSIEKSRPSWEIGRSSWSIAPYDPELNDYSIGSYTPSSMTPRFMYTPSQTLTPGRTTPIYRDSTPSRAWDNWNPYHVNRSCFERDPSIPGSVTPSKLDRDRSLTIDGMVGEAEFDAEKAHMPAAPSTNVVKKVGKMALRVVKRMLQVPILYGSVLGFVWSLNRWRIPSWMFESINLLAEPTIGVAMLLLGMVSYKFYKSAGGFIPCGWKLLCCGFAIRFIFCPIVMWVCALAFNIHGYHLNYAILQVVVPQGSMTFALAQIYGCKVDIICPAVYIQMLVFVPFMLADSAFLTKI